MHTCPSHGSIDRKDDKCFLCERPVGYKCLHNASTYIRMLVPCTMNSVVVRTTHFRRCELVFEEFGNPFLEKGQDLMLADNSVGKQLKQLVRLKGLLYWTMTWEMGKTHHRANQ